MKLPKRCEACLIRMPDPGEGGSQGSHVQGGRGGGNPFSTRNRAAVTESRLVTKRPSTTVPKRCSTLTCISQVRAIGEGGGTLSRGWVGERVRVDVVRIEEGVEVIDGHAEKCLSS